MRKPSRSDVLDRLAAVKLNIERVRLEAMEAKLEAAKPEPEEKAYIRYEDLPPLHPDDEPAVKERFKKLFYNQALAQHAARRRKLEYLWESMNASFGGSQIGTAYLNDIDTSSGIILPEDVESFQPIWEAKWHFL